MQLDEVAPTPRQLRPAPGRSGSAGRSAGRRRARRAGAGAAGAAIVAAGALLATSLSGGGPATGTSRLSEGLTVREVPIGDGSAHLIATIRGAAPAPASSGLVGTVAGSEVGFALGLTRQLAAETPGRNVVDSPLSADLAMSMLELGAQGGTQREIADALQAPSVSAGSQAAAWAQLVTDLQSGGQGELDVANSAWLQRSVTFAPSYLRALTRSYGDDAYLADFSGHGAAATAAINRWVGQHTAGSIRQLFRPGELDPSTILVLADALNFDAAWAPRVDMSSTTETFTAGDDRPATVPAIQNDRGGLPLRVAVTAGYDAVEIPYQGGRYQAVVIEPPAGTINGFVRALDARRLDRILASTTSTAVTLTMPSLDLGANLSLNGALSGLGMAGVFRSGADLSGISPEADHVGVVQQADRLVVNTHGTHFSAATGIGVVVSAIAEPVLSVTIDHPYLLLLREPATGLIVAESVVTSPAAAD